MIAERVAIIGKAGHSCFGGVLFEVTQKIKGFRERKSIGTGSTVFVFSLNHANMLFITLPGESCPLDQLLIHQIGSLSCP